jgi:hypothetical protein
MTAYVTLLQSTTLFGRELANIYFGYHLSCGSSNFSPTPRNCDTFAKRSTRTFPDPDPDPSIKLLAIIVPTTKAPSRQSIPDPSQSVTLPATAQPPHLALSHHTITTTTTA